jgi:peptidoglycan/LPS O-acetylase OafA/YrhL
MLQCLGAGASLLPVSWSLSTEWIAYLAFPLLATQALHRGAARACAVGMVCMASLLALCAIPDAWLHGFQPRSIIHAPLDHTDLYTPFPLVRCLAEFCLGLIAWSAATVARLAAAARHTSPRAGVMLLCVVVLCTPLADYLVVPLFAVLLVCRYCAPESRFFAGPIVHWLGLVSYSLYLSHLLVWQLIHGEFDRVGMPPLLLLVPSVATAALCYYGIELPMRRLMRGEEIARDCAPAPR